MLTLAILGFRPLTLFGYTLSGALALVGVILLIEIGSMGAVVGTGVALAYASTHANRHPHPHPDPDPHPYSHTHPCAPHRDAHVNPHRYRNPCTHRHDHAHSYPNVLRGISAANGGGARLRSSPNGPAFTAMNNDTLVLVLSDQFVVAGGMTWVNVRIMPDGPEGWVLQELLDMATPSPNW